MSCCPTSVNPSGLSDCITAAGENLNKVGAAVRDWGLKNGAKMFAWLVLVDACKITPF